MKYPPDKTTYYWTTKRTVDLPSSDDCFWYVECWTANEVIMFCSTKSMHDAMALWVLHNTPTVSTCGSCGI